MSRCGLDPEAWQLGTLWLPSLRPTIQEAHRDQLDFVWDEHAEREATKRYSPSRCPAKYSYKHARPALRAQRLVAAQAGRSSTPLLYSPYEASPTPRLTMDSNIENNNMYEKQATTTTYGTASDGTVTPDTRPKLQRIGTERQWARRKQRGKLTWHLVWRLLISIALCALTAMVLILFQNAYIIPNNYKNLFNAAITGLSIGIGINIAAGLVQIARHARWYLLSRKPLHADQFENVFECESQTATLKLMFSKYSGWLTRLGCLAWLLFNIGIQVLIALLGLTYSLASPTENNSYHIGISNGTSSVALLNPITDLAAWLNHQPNPIKDQQALANVYGQQLTNFLQTNASLPGFGSEFRLCSFARYQ